MHLGIEIGGTKLQLGVGAGDGSPLAELERFDVDAARGAEGIRGQILLAARTLLARYEIARIGCGFGGPIDAAAGRVVRSHHVEGWADFPLAAWLQESLLRPVTIANDADTAGLAEARFGAGRGANPVFYVTVGTGIGGGLIVDGRIYRGNGAGAAELGHLRPGLDAASPEENLESVAAGWGIAAQMNDRLRQASAGATAVSAVRSAAERSQATGDVRPGDDPSRLGGSLALPGLALPKYTARDVAELAATGDAIALEVMDRATQALGWGLAQMITLLAPEVVVVGGGVSLSGENFFAPLREQTARYVFPPFAGTYRIEPAALGEEVVVHGALALAADNATTSP